MQWKCFDLKTLPLFYSITGKWVQHWAISYCIDMETFTSSKLKKLNVSKMFKLLHNKKGKTESVITNEITLLSSSAVRLLQCWEGVHTNVTSSWPGTQFSSHQSSSMTFSQPILLIQSIKPRGTNLWNAHLDLLKSNWFRWWISKYYWWQQIYHTYQRSSPPKRALRLATDPTSRWS